MSRRSSRLALILVALFWAGSAPCQDPAGWMARVEQLLAKPGGAPEALKALRSLPVEIRGTADYQWMGARTHMALAEHDLCAINAATYRFLPRSIERDFTAVNRWLAGRAEEFMALATESLAKGLNDEAAKRYFEAVLCNQAILGRQDEGLGKQTLTALDRLVKTTPNRADYWFGLGFYNYYFSHLEAARRAFEVAIDKEPDPYRKWMLGVWRQRTEAEMAVERQQDEQEKKAKADREAREARVAASGPGPGQTASGVPGEAERYEAALHRSSLDADIREVDRRIFDLKGKLAGRVTVLTNGTVGVEAVNHKKVNEELQQLEARRSDLVSQRDGPR
ncbi:MAG: hypothetical protein HY815_02865 [Candidatus Riflebacteria bacterium]|nr:hypothetical protein [Candidatus Riflebacteria bacterium]